MKLRFRERLKKLLQIKGKPTKLALAFGIGVFLGILPGTGAVAAAGLAAVFHLNVPLAVAGAMLTNPVTGPLVYVGSFLIGQWLLGNRVVEHKITRILLTTATGSLILAAGLALVGFALVWALASWHQARAHRKDKHAAGH